MPTTTLLVAGAIATIVAATYAIVSWQLWRRGGSDATRRPLRYFALWWGALSANLAGVAVTYFLASYDALDLTTQIAGSQIQRLLLAVSMVGLISYLLVVLTGRDLVVPIGIVYGAYFAASIYSLTIARPIDVLVGKWRTDLVYAQEGAAWMDVLSLAVIVLPPLVCGAAFLVASRRASAPQKYRMRLVSFAVVFWWVVAVAAGQRSALENDAFQALHRVLSLIAALLVLAAYHPPAWARRRFGAEAYPLA